MRASLLLSLAFALTAQIACAATMSVQNAWIPAPPPGATTAVAYGKLINGGPTSDRFTGAHSPVAGSMEIHQMSTAGGVMRMRPVHGGIAMGAGAAVRIAPGGYHLMLIGLKRPLKAGDHVKIVLEFERDAPLDVDFPVKPAASAGGMGGM